LWIVIILLILIFLYWLLRRKKEGKEKEDVGVGSEEETLSSESTGGLSNASTKYESIEKEERERGLGGI